MESVVNTGSLAPASQGAVHVFFVFAASGLLAFWPFLHKEDELLSCSGLTDSVVVKILQNSVYVV